MQAPSDPATGAFSLRHITGYTTLHDEGRHLYRPLATWAETDIGRFHRRLSLLMIGEGVIFSLLTLSRWLGKPGTGLLLAALTFGLACVTRDLHAAWADPDDAIDSRMIDLEFCTSRCRIEQGGEA